MDVIWKEWRDLFDIAIPKILNELSSSPLDPLYRLKLVLSSVVDPTAQTINSRLFTDKIPLYTASFIAAINTAKDMVQHRRKQIIRLLYPEVEIKMLPGYMNASGCADQKGMTVIS